MAGRRDNIELVWSISELSSLFERKTNTDGFLKEVVDHVAEHLDADVCSVYLLDESQGRLVLRATRGLDTESVGHVTLGIGEGITGTAVKELRPIREARGARNPYYKYIPETNEEQYQSFLAVPIRRGLTRIGAIVVQHTRQAHFTREDTRALQAIAGQLAATLENAEIIMELHAHRAPRTVEPRTLPDQIDCKPASEGVAIGKVTHLSLDDLLEEQEQNDQVQPEAQEQMFQAALERTDHQLELLQQELDERLSDIASLIFGTHLLMLRDEEFSGQMRTAIRSGMSAARAVRSVTNRYVELLSASGNSRTQEKTQDIRDLGSRLLRNLAPEDDEYGDLRGRVVVSHELFPSDLVRIAVEHAAGVIIAGSSATAHITILARSLEIPSVLLRQPEEVMLVENELVIVDAYEGRIHRNPGESLLEQFRSVKAAHEKSDEPQKRGPALTRDGETVRLLANVNILHDVELAQRVGAEGVGLYRSEFPFLVRNDFPSESEQFSIYRRIAERMDGGPLVFRTLDIGGDKLFSEAEYTERNPFLGLRGIRFSLAHEELFDEQLRAMLRAGAGYDLHILFPMVASVDEFMAAKRRLAEVRKQLSREKLPHNTKARCGVMVELPSAVEVADSLAKRADFLSIGSNDLVMYLLAVDRANEHVQDLYQPFHPAILRALNRVVAAATAASCPVSICGEAGADPLMAEFLVGCGLRTFSTDPGRLPALRRTIGSVSVSRAERFARRLLGFDQFSEVSSFLRKRTTT